VYFKTVLKYKAYLITFLLDIKVVLAKEVGL